MKYSNRGPIVLAFSVLMFWTPSLISGQTLLLPSPPNFVRGVGQCSDLSVAIYTKNWRVRKGDVFEVLAKVSTAPRQNIDYSWTVSNGKIVSGQSTSTLLVKAGGKKTAGYINVTGFVWITLTVRTRSGECNLTTESSTMIGRNREVNQTPNVYELVLDEERLTQPCRPGCLPREGQRISDDMMISVTTNAGDPENDVLSYHYSVTGGKIHGNGWNVRWDLTGVPPGTYTITAAVDDGYGIYGQTVSKVITVAECSVACDCTSCPTIGINDPVENAEGSSIVVLTHTFREGEGLDQL